MDSGSASRETGVHQTYEQRVSAAVKAAWEVNGMSLNAFAEQANIPRTMLRRKLEAVDDFRFGEVGRIAALFAVPLESLALPAEDDAA